MKQLGLVLCLLALSGCGSKGPAADAAPANSVKAAPAAALDLPLGGVDLAKPLRVGGTEPFWTLDLAPGSAIFTDYSATTPMPEQLVSVTPEVNGSTAVYTSKNASGTPVLLTLTAKECLESGEPDNSKPLTAELKIEGKTLFGCAGAAPADSVPVDNMELDGNAES